ncbi:YbdD/YjiX family protein [Glutamicibacter sp. M10]|uniref:YbdD/YjiX family protein n=1 Tax=Glutamicibacter sp. M10 TaxID=3023076 RepID=UPI0029056028|nr:YbdD/YjiX family protein [Glutamicibacter sp. M10]
MASLLERLGQAKRFVDGVLGADKYQHYLEHHQRNHPDQQPMNEREFWKDYTDWQEKTLKGVAARCTACRPRSICIGGWIEAGFVLCRFHKLAGAPLPVG